MSTYETTVKISHISTSGKARNGLSVADAVGSAKAHLRYITRDDAAEDGNIIARTDGQFLDGTTDDLKTAARQAIDARSQKHTDAYGVRLTDKMMVSLPNDATIAEQRQMCANIIEDFTADSEAFGMAAIHTDKAGNAHAHFLFVDGLETREAAKARRPDAKRVRRADALRLNEGGNRQEVRASVAASINAVALPAGRRTAEVRSFKERGIEREPQAHEGPQVFDKLERQPENHKAITPGVLARLKANAVALRRRLERETIERASIEAERIPQRYRKGWLGKTLFGWLEDTNSRRTAGQSETVMDAIDNGTAAFVADWPQQAPTAPERSHEPPQALTRPPAAREPETLPQGVFARSDKAQSIITGMEKAQQAAREQQKPKAPVSKQKNRGFER